MKWYYVVDGARQGPVDFSDLETLLEEKKITLGTLVWNPSLGTQWSRIKDLSVFFETKPKPLKVITRTGAAARGFKKAGDTGSWEKGGSGLRFADEKESSGHPDHSADGASTLIGQHSDEIISDGEAKMDSLSGKHKQSWWYAVVTILCFLLPAAVIIPAGYYFKQDQPTLETAGLAIVAGFWLFAIGLGIWAKENHGMLPFSIICVGSVIAFGIRFLLPMPLPGAICLGVWLVYVCYFVFAEATSSPLRAFFTSYLSSFAIFVYQDLALWRELLGF